MKTLKWYRSTEIQPYNWKAKIFRLGHKEESKCIAKIESSNWPNPKHWFYINYNKTGHEIRIAKTEVMAIVEKEFVGN